MSKRDNYIDFIRFLGITLIIIAHINAPAMLTQIRCFDVPLMIFASGLAYSNKKIKATWHNFYWPRIKRLLIPVYIFIPFYLLLLLIADIPVTKELCVRSFLLTLRGSIGYVWIIRVFLLMTLVTPLLIKTKSKFNNMGIMGTILLILCLNEIAVLSIHKVEPMPIYLEVYTDIVPYLFGYSTIFLLGLSVNTTCKSMKQGMGTHLALVLTMVIGSLFFIYHTKINSGAFSFVAYKFPPRMIYLVYGIICCLIIWWLKPYIGKLADIRFVLFVGRNTIWIYLWHMVYVIIANKYLPHWGERFLFVYFISIVTYYVQFRIIEYINSKKHFALLNYFKG